jgi:hypothetical protein
LVRAPDCGSGGPGFKPRCSPFTTNTLAAPFRFQSSHLRGPSTRIFFSGKRFALALEPSLTSGFDRMELQHLICGAYSKLLESPLQASHRRSSSDPQNVCLDQVDSSPGQLLGRRKPSRPVNFADGLGLQSQTMGESLTDPRNIRGATDYSQLQLLTMATRPYLIEYKSSIFAAKRVLSECTNTSAF